MEEAPEALIAPKESRIDGAGVLVASQGEDVPDL